MVVVCPIVGPVDIPVAVGNTGVGFTGTASSSLASGPPTVRVVVVAVGWLRLSVVGREQESSGAEPWAWFRSSWTGCSRCCAPWKSRGQGQHHLVEILNLRRQVPAVVLTCSISSWNSFNWQGVLSTPGLSRGACFTHCICIYYLKHYHVPP